MKKVLLFLTCLSISLVCLAQARKFTATFNPLSLLEPDGGFTPGIGYNFSNQLAIYSDVGIIFYDAFLNNGERQRINLSYKFKPAIRFYLNNKVTPSGSFFELEGIYKRVNYRDNNDVNIIDNNGNVAYIYSGGYNKIKQVTGASFKYGYRFFLNSEKRLGIDVFVGLGNKSYNIKATGLPPNANINEFEVFRNINSLIPENGNAPSFPFGGKLFYSF